ncbi:MAG: ComEC/Rec2 family competence protein, partial [Clostridia bacterium]
EQQSEDKEKNDEKSNNKEPASEAADVKNKNEIQSQSNINNQNKSPSPASPTGPLKVHFINVGQGDAILIKTPHGKNMVIDAGDNKYANEVVNYIKNEKVKKIDIVVGSHPHADHIGSLDEIINSFEIGKVYLPKASHNTQTFENLLLAIKNKGLKVTTAAAGTNIELDSEVIAEIIAPNSTSYESLNNYSAVIRLMFGDTAFLFSGDAEDISEEEILNKGHNIKADVLKVGHHGSNTSTTSAFLKAVSPSYGIIMVGSDNEYGHPTVETLSRLKGAGVEIFRTDESGTVIAVSDGRSVTFETQKFSPVKPNAPPKQEEKISTEKQTNDNANTNVYIDANGKGLIKGSKSKIYHIPGSQYYDKTTNVVKWFKTVEEAEVAGYRAPKK